MNQISEFLYRKIHSLSTQVKEDFQKRGVAIPTLNDDGSIRVGSYVIIKENTGFYSITDIKGYLVADQINLPQTAILLANGLALGRFLDKKLIQIDKKYGYASFEEALHSRVSKKKKSLDSFCVSQVKQQINQLKKESYRKEITNHFEKLIKFGINKIS